MDANTGSRQSQPPSSTNATRSPRHLRVFLASPGDVADERGLALTVLEQLQYDPLLRGRITLETVAWDKPGAGTPLLATMTPQEAIKQGLPTPAQCDIVIVLFWSRIGTPLPADWKKPDGSGYLSGTEWEYLNALEAAERQGKPEVLVYRRMENIMLNLDDPAFDEKSRQGKLVKQFFQSFENPDGSLRRGYNLYPAPEEFREQLNLHLRALVRELLEREAPGVAVPPVTLAPPAAGPPLWSGSPFPGLRAFTPADAPIFFGRGRETDGLVSRLNNSASRFLTVVGASGSGKSSLVAAGLIPRLLAGALVGSQDWAWFRFTPGEVGENPFMALAVPFKDLLQPQDQQPRDLANKLEKNPAALTELRDLALAGKPAWAELLLFIDQFEELFTLAAPRYVGPFVEWLRQAAQTARVHVVMTLRADFYHRCLEWPLLTELLKNGSYPLAAPGPGALYEMITRPAERAGLVFEEGLADQILKETGTEPGTLPLMAFALAELYKAKTADGHLTQAAYDSFHGVQGAIAKRAEDTFGKLGVAEGVLGKVFQELVEVDEQGTLTRQPALRERVTKLADAEKLVDVLITARLLVAGEGNQPVVEVAHEALLKSWPRLADWIKDTQEDLRLLRQVKLAAVEWEQHGRDANYAWSFKRLLPAVKMLERLQPPPFNEAERLFMRPVNRRELLGNLDDPATTSEKRVVIGVRLAERGDTRPGVGLRLDGLPDLLWVRIPGTATVQDSGQFPTFTGLRLGNGAKPDPEADDDEAWPADAKPLEIADFELAVYPVTVAQFRPFVEQSGYQEDRYWSKAGRGWADQERRTVPAYWDDPTWTVANHPVVGVSWYEAEAYCAWLNERLPADQAVRLPTEAEWEWAARGPEGRRYPWGDEPPERRCHFKRWLGFMRHPCAVGMFPNGASNWWQAIWPERDVVQDLAGNVWEWTGSEYTKDYAGADQSVLGLNRDGGRVIRGGYWSSDRTGCAGLRAALRDGSHPRRWFDIRGFRLARTVSF